MADARLKEIGRLLAQADVAERVGLSLKRFGPHLKQRLVEAAIRENTSGTLAENYRRAVRAVDAAPQMAGATDEQRALAVLAGFLGDQAREAERIVVEVADKLLAERDRLLGDAEEKTTEAG